MMTTKQVAARYYELAQQGLYQQIHQELYAEDAISIEQEAMFPGAPLQVQGKEALAQKGKNWQDAMEEMISGRCSEPIVAGNCFACTMGFEAKMKGKDEVTKDEEVCVFHVSDGKITKEQFFW